MYIRTRKVLGSTRILYDLKIICIISQRNKKRVQNPSNLTIHCNCTPAKNTTQIVEFVSDGK